MDNNDKNVHKQKVITFCDVGTSELSYSTRMSYSTMVLVQISLQISLLISLRIIAYITGAKLLILVSVYGFIGCWGASPYIKKEILKK